MSIELRHLRYFLAVADTLHFGQAAERLGMSQPPLSQQIRQLEELIGARLFVRSHRRVQLTPAGELLQERARAIVQQVETAVDEVQRAQRGEQGELHIGLTRATPLSPQIPRSILRYRQQYPQVRLQLSEMNTLQQIDALLDGSLDVGIIRKRAAAGTGGAQPVRRPAGADRARRPPCPAQAVEAGHAVAARLRAGAVRSVPP